MLLSLKVTLWHTGYMTPRDELQKRIERKRADISNIKSQLRDAEVYIQALEEAIKLLPRESPDTEPPTALRPGSQVARARDILMEHGKPMHVQELVKALGKEPDHNNRAALSGSLSAYVRKHEIFTRPSPNTFGLVEFNGKPPLAKHAGPPPEFGFDDEERTEM
jgi:hypothetical protein